jgi:hypothetical protein
MSGEEHAPVSDVVWKAFCGELGDAALATSSLAANRDALDASDGHVQLATLLEAGLRWYLRGDDADFPRFIEINDTPEVADNLFAAVRADATYRVSGDVSSLFDFNISVHTNWAWLGPSTVSGDLGRQDLVIDESGHFELMLSAQQQPGNWLPLPPNAAYIQIREYHADFGPHRSGSFDIVRLGSSGQAPKRLEPDVVAAKLRQAASWARNYVTFHQRAQARIFPAEANSMHPPGRQKGGNRNIWYGFGRFEIQPGEALVVEFAQPNARLWSIQWLLDPWYESGDLLNRMTGMPGREVRVDSDGRIRVVLSGRDPGVPNWLDTSSYARGFFVTRWIWCEQGPDVHLSLVRLDQLRARLPADTPVFTPEQRAAQLARRRKHFVLRRR